MKSLSILFTALILTATFSSAVIGQDDGWDEYSGNPIIKPDTSGWNRGGVFAPTVIMFKDTLRMWYMGSTAFDFNADIHIGYAWSLDGITWQQYSENPVFSPREGEWDYPDIFYPYVIADGDTLRMWYGGGYIRLGDAKRREYMQIGYATSLDCINWNRYPDPVIKPVVSGSSWNRDGVLSGGVIKEDGIYKMWFGGGIGPLIPAVTSKWSIGYATSSDCIHWNLLPDPVITHSDSSTDFDEKVAGHAYVIRTNGGYDMWYYGLSGKIGYASSSDGILWTKYDKNPVLSPTSVSPQWTTAYYEPSVYFDGALFHIWFTGWDEVTDRIATIGYATSELDTSHYPPGIVDIIAKQPYIDRTFVQKNADSVMFSTRFVNNYNRHFTANLIYSNLGNTLIDSVTLYDDGLHDDSLTNDGLYGAYIPPIQIEDYFQLNVSTTDNQTNKYVNTPVDQYRFTTVGPIKIDSLSVTNVSSTNYMIKPYFSNEGSSYTAQDLKIKIMTSDNSVTQIAADSISIANIAPASIAGPTDDIDITVNSNFSGVFNLNFEIMSDGWTYWKDSISQVMTGIDDKEQAPLSYNLSQNYPNPFNPSTNIKYSIPKTSLVTLKVYDITGREVEYLINEEKPPGNYIVNFNANGLSSGVYFYKIEAGSFVKVNKMILLH